MTEINQSLDSRPRPEQRIPALAVSRGIGIGPVVFLHDEKRKFFKVDLPGSELEAELRRLGSAADMAAAQLRDLALETSLSPNKPVSGIFGVHLLIIEESSLLEKVTQVIQTQQVNAEWALEIVADDYHAKQSAVADPHLREKYLDIEDVIERIRKALNGSRKSSHSEYAGSVVIARELRPSSMMELIKASPIAIVTERGGWTSHTSILAREFEVPMVSGIKNLDRTFFQNETVIVDGVTGTVIKNASAETLTEYRVLGDQSDRSDNHFAGEGKNAVTLDESQISIRANVDTAQAYANALALGAVGIGLFRSESLLDRPGIIDSEDEQVLAYRLLAKAANDAPVNIRTFDIGVDRLNDNGTTPEVNPSLGLRAIRLSLSDPDHFRTQVRAILRASVGNNISLVLPMISGVSEIMRSRSIIDDESSRLRTAGTLIGIPKIGAMIEVPSAVFTAAEIAQKVDFLCLGTNDLVQYLLAVDRDNDAVADFYQSLHPAVLRAVTEVISASTNADIPLIVCGEMAGSPFYVPLLIGLGVREFSMNTNSIRQISRLISGIRATDCADLIETIGDCLTADEIETRLRGFYRQKWSHLFSPGILDSRHH